METPQVPPPVPPPPAAPQPAGSYPVTPVRNSGMAMASLILGILGCVTCITGIAGLILGIISLTQINSSRGRIGGQGLAIAGIVVSAASMICFYFFMILALIVVPKLMGAARIAKEATLKANLQQLRSAVSQFQADTGAYPARLEDIVATSAPTKGAGGMKIPSRSYKGPYLTAEGGIGGHGIPMNPFVSSTDTTVSDHWKYTPDGSVSSAATGTTIDGEAYTSL